jgi:WD40 repeat protein
LAVNRKPGEMERLRESGSSRKPAVPGPTGRGGPLGSPPRTAAFRVQTASAGQRRAATTRSGCSFGTQPRGKDVCRWQGHPGSVRVLAFARDGKCLASAGSDTTVLVWEVARLLAE